PRCSTANAWSVPCPGSPRLSAAPISATVASFVLKRVVRLCAVQASDAADPAAAGRPARGRDRRAAQIRAVLETAPDRRYATARWAAWEASVLDPAVASLARRR